MTGRGLAGNPDGAIPQSIGCAGFVAFWLFVLVLCGWLGWRLGQVLVEVLR